MDCEFRQIADASLHTGVNGNTMSSTEDNVMKVKKDKKLPKTKEDGKKRTKSSKRSKSKDSSASKAIRSEKKKERAAKKRGDKQRGGVGAPSKGKTASKKSKARQEKTASKSDDRSSTRKSKTSKSRKKGGKSSGGKRKSVFRKIYNKLRGPKGKKKKSKRKSSSKSGKASESSKMATTASSMQHGGTAGVGHHPPEELASSSKGSQRKHEDGGPGDFKGKANEQHVPDPKVQTPNTPGEKMPDEKSAEAVEISGPSSTQEAKASSSETEGVKAPKPTGKPTHEKALDTEKEPTEKLDPKAPASAPALLATSAEPLPVQKNGTAASPPVKTAVLEAVQSDNHATSTVGAEPIGDGQAQPPPTPKPRETVIQPERLPIKDDDLPDAASSTTFACPETHMEHSGGISVDWASLQDFLLPEFAAVLQMNFQE